MPITTDTFNDDIIELLRSGNIGVIRTDTLYGIVARADNEAAVERIYDVKSRDDNKQPIVLIHDVRDIYDSPDPTTQTLLESVWPDRISVIVNSPAAPKWLLRGQNNRSIAYRIPADTALRNLLQQTGPLIAPSANPQSQAPAATIQQAIDYFGDTVDFYVDGGEVTDMSPSQLLRIDAKGNVERLR